MLTAQLVERRHAVRPGQRCHRRSPAHERRCFFSGNEGRVLTCCSHTLASRPVIGGSPVHVTLSFGHEPPRWN